MVKCVAVNRLFKKVNVRGTKRFDRRLVYRLRASTWQPVDWGFFLSRVILKTLKIVYAAFAPGARHKRKCEGFCVCVVRHVMSLNSVQSFVIENCNGPTIENGLNKMARTFTFYQKV